MTDDEIRELWRDPSFSGSFAGVRNFQATLALEKGVHKDITTLFHILRQDPDFVVEMKRERKTFPRRSIMVHGVGRLWQADLAILFSFEGFIGFLLCVDVFSRAIFCEKIKNKDAKTIRLAFEKIFKEAGLKPDKLESDRGAEFVGNKDFFKKNKIFFKIKTGRHKAAFAEKGIQIVKRRLFRLLRTLRKENWPDYLESVVKAINNSPNIAIGFLRPSEIKAPEDDPKVDKAKGLKEDVSFQDQEEKQKKYERNSSLLQKGDHVHADFGPSVFAKGFDSPNYQLYKISRVDAGKFPVLFKLEDLAKDPVPGYFYKEQLTKALPPKDGTFRVEKIIKEELRKGKPYVYVKYHHYPNKFNQWIPKSNFVD